MSENKPICAICGVSLPKCGSFVQCHIFPTGYVCTTCCIHCMHFRWAGSLPRCMAALSEKEK